MVVKNEDKIMLPKSLKKGLHDTKQNDTQRNKLKRDTQHQRNTA